MFVLDGVASKSMLNSTQPNAGIKWSWLVVSGFSLLTGAIYLTAIHLTGPTQLAQDQIQDQITESGDQASR
jgi:hypothetical protein